ncbi:FAD-dependent oxidoreductase [Rubrivivax albus]|uniref:FAD-dependent oxidoreductase n=1 Tax=Rubrivivax albus TaxID=2499835 RepID=UPI0026B0C8A5
MDIDVAIVGAGACGLTAATALRETGIGCLLLERDATPSGSTALSSGFIPAAGTRWQHDAGVHDSPEAFAADIQAKAKGRAAAHLVKAYTEASAPALDLLARHGVEFELLDGFLYPGHHARRMHALRERTGAALMAALERAAQADVLTEARVVGLQPEGQGWRLTAARPNGATESLTARAVLLACNGFGGNPAMVREFLPEMRDALFAGHTGNDGTAIHLGRGLGAATADLGGYQGHGSWVVPQGALMTWAVMMQGGVQLNAQGRRFHDETAGYSEAAVHVLAQPGGVAWNVFAEPQLALARGFPDFRDAEAAGALRVAPDLDALARLIGCADVDLGGADLAPPYYAVKVTGALFHTQGGLDIDDHCRVRRADGGVFPTLLAAGGAARGVSGDAVWGYLSGNGMLSAVAGGFIAARTLEETLR